MKKASFVAALIVVILVVMLIACDLSLFTERENSESFEISTSIPSDSDSATSRGTINSDTAVITHVYVKVFDSSGTHLPSATDTGVSELTYSGAEGKWSASVRLASPVSGNIVFTLWAINASDQHLYAGSYTFAVGTNNNIVVIPTQAGYTVGDKGPGGGCIIYDAGNYDTGWRYIEASSTDFSYSWEGIPIDKDLHVDTGTGDVVVDTGKTYLFDAITYSAGEIVMHTSEWYWSIPDFTTPPSTGDLSANFGTVNTIGAGVENNRLLRLDAISGVTPQIKKMPGRKELSTSSQRRDVAKTLGGGNVIVGGVTTPYYAQEINGYADWFIPSKDELHYMYDLKATLNLSGKYWSSTESVVADNPSKTIDGSSYTALALNSWMEDFSLVKGSAQVQDLRSTLAKVRPVRRF